jgi:hypothetical protein
MAFKVAINEKIKQGETATITAKPIQLPDVNEVIEIDAPVEKSEDGGALAKEPEKTSNLKSTKAGRNTTNKTGKTTSKKK